MPDGTLGTTVGLSAQLPILTPNKARPLMRPGGASAQLLEKVERLGLADERWRLLADALFATGIEGDEGLLALYCIPTFVKLRLRDSEALDAKVYLQAGASVL